jgi:dinuclear metal center YbgI/SA1388 family protein
MKVKDFLDIIDRLAPPELAMDWDNSGLQVGDKEAEVKRVALALDPTSANIRQALKSECQLLITHHPLIFKPISQVSLQNPLTAPVFLAVSGGLAIIAAHSNWDATGVAYELADLLELTNLRVMSPESLTYLKLVVFVPPTHLDVIKRAVFKAGAGVIGAYDQCFFRVSGQGGFRVPLDGHPFSGQPGAEHTTQEERLEIILPLTLKNKVCEAIRASHPYEEPAFEFYEVQTMEAGSGLSGEWNPPRYGQEIIKKVLGSNVRLIGPKPQLISQIALLPGSGGNFILDAQRTGADLYITGELNHHQALLAQEIGLSVLSAGHFETERPSMFRLQRELQKVIDPQHQVTFTMLEETPPFQRF